MGERAMISMLVEIINVYAQLDLKGHIVKRTYALNAMCTQHVSMVNVVVVMVTKEMVTNALKNNVRTAIHMQYAWLENAHALMVGQGMDNIAQEMVQRFQYQVTMILLYVQPAVLHNVKNRAQ